MVLYTARVSGIFLGCLVVSGVAWPVRVFVSVFVCFRTGRTGFGQACPAGLEGFFVFVFGG